MCSSDLILFGSSVLSAFSESRSDKASHRAELFFIIYIVLFRIYLSAVAASVFSESRSNRRHTVFSESCSDRRCCPLFRNPVRTKFPAETFHPLRTADRRATNVPRRILQTMFRSVTIFMRSTVSGNSLLPNRFSDHAHNFSNAHRERITAAASFFSSEKVRKTDGTAAARSQSFRSDALCKVTPSEQIMPERHYRENFSLKKCTAK